jgi:hypothetical protein
VEAVRCFTTAELDKLIEDAKASEREFAIALLKSEEAEIIAELQVSAESLKRTLLRAYVQTGSMQVIHRNGHRIEGNPHRTGHHVQDALNVNSEANRLVYLALGWRPV